MPESKTQKVVEILRENWKAEMRGFCVYSQIAESEPDQTRRRAIRGLAAAEKHHAELWADRLHTLGAEVPRFDDTFAKDALKGMSDTGLTRLRSLELEESQDIAKYGQQLQLLDDAATTEILHRVIKEEQEHYRVLQKLSTPASSDGQSVEAAKRALDELLLKRQKGRIRAGSWVGDAIYGINDGLGSIFGIVSGVSGATLGNSHFVLIAGMAGMVASALSMGSGAYLAAKSEREIYEAEFAREKEAVRLNPVEARELLSLTYQVRGLPQADADRVVEHLATGDQQLGEALARERMSITEDGLRNPWTSAISGALSTAVGAFIPVIPFFFSSGLHAVVIAAIVSLAAHFAVGAAKTLITNRAWWSSGFEMTWVGALEGGVTYVIGIALGHLGGGS